MTTSPISAPPRAWFPGGERIAFLLAFLAVLYGAYVTVRPVLLVVVFAAAIASLSFGAYRWMVTRVRGRRRLAAGLTVALVLIGVLAPLLGIGFFAVHRLVAEIIELTQRLREDGTASLAPFIDRLGPLGPPFERALARILPAIADAAPALASSAGRVLGVIGRSVVKVGISLFLLGVSLYYFFIEGEAWRERLLRLLPLPASDVRAFFSQFRRVSLGVFVGNVGTAAVQGAVAGLGYLLLGAPVPLLAGMLSFVGALIPLVGTALVWVPLAIYLGVAEAWWRGVLLAAYGALIVGTVDNVVRPLLTRRGLHIHPLLAFVAIFGGIGAYGPAGIFLGPLFIALAVTVVDLHERRPHEPSPAEGNGRAGA